MLIWKKAEPRPIDFPQANFTYTAPPGMEDSCGKLRCFRAPGQAISCWKFPIVDRIRFLVTGKMWAYMLMDAHPPISFMTTSPFGPVPMQVDESEPAKIPSR